MSSPSDRSAVPGSNRAERRRNGARGGEVARLVNGPHDRAWLYSGTWLGSGQDRVDSKRNARAAFWRTVRVRVHAHLEQAFRENVGLLGEGARVLGRSEVPDAPVDVVDLHVHIPGAPEDAVSADPMYFREKVGPHEWRTELDSVLFYRADGSVIGERVESA